GRADRMVRALLRILCGGLPAGDDRVPAIARPPQRRPGDEGRGGDRSWRGARDDVTRRGGDSPLDSASAAAILLFRRARNQLSVLAGRKPCAVPATNGCCRGPV